MLVFYRCCLVKVLCTVMVGEGPEEVVRPRDGRQRTLSKLKEATN